MKYFISLLLSIFLWQGLYGQHGEEREIVEEGVMLYKTERASWIGTDIFLERFSNKRVNSGGYFSYVENEKSVCVFLSKGDNPKIISMFVFDTSFSISNSMIDTFERELSVKERDLFLIRKVALKELKSDTLFKFYKDMSPNIIPISDENGKRVYIVTGPTKSGILVLGNDYLLKFNNKNELKSKERIHRNIISMSLASSDLKEATSSSHTHLYPTSEFITATDICTLMLYQKFMPFKQHIVVSKKWISIWDCRSNKLAVLSKVAWDRITKDQMKRHPKP